MPSFKDNRGREWPLMFTVGTARAVEAATGFSIDLQQGDPAALVRLKSETSKLAEVLWALVAEAAAGDSIDQDAFYHRLDGDALAGGWDALRELAVSIAAAKSPRLAEALTAAIDKQLEAQDAACDALVKTLSSDATQAHLTRELGKLQAKFQKALADSFNEAE